MGLLDKALGKVFSPLIEGRAMEMNKAWRQISPDDAKRPPKSMLFDPMSLVYSMGYKDRRSNLSYDILRNMPSQLGVLAAIINTRVNQVATFTSPYRRTRNIGFEIKHKDRDHKLTKSEKRFIVELESFISNCGKSSPNKHSTKPRDNFDQFTRKVIRDRMIYDQLCFEVIPDRRGLPYEFVAVDASTIRLAADPKANENRDKQREQDELKPFMNHYGGLDLSYPIIDPKAGTKASYVQIWQGSIIRAYKQEELGFCIANPRTDVRVNGYGHSEFEQLVNVITSHLWAEEYNRNFFKQGAAPKGILNIRGDNIAPEQLEGFKRQWVANVSGVQNAWRTPILQSEEIQYLNMQGSNLDMEYSRWLEYLIKITCAVFLISPEEIGFGLSTGGMQQPMFESNNEWKIKASKDRGLRPLLRFYADALNRNVIDKLDDRFYLDFVGLDELTEKERIELRQQQVQFFRTINEIRSDEDLDPIEDGDIIMNPIYIQKIQMEHQWKLEAEQRKEQKKMQAEQEKMQKEQMAQQQQMQQQQLKMQQDQVQQQGTMQQQQVDMQQQQVGGDVPSEGAPPEAAAMGLPAESAPPEGEPPAGGPPEEAPVGGEPPAGGPPEEAPVEGEPPSEAAPEASPEEEPAEGGEVSKEEIQEFINSLPPEELRGKDTEDEEESE
tara:strand:- start:5848 stop:7845 length:1998 start_codon:yes stop_codon:yes gene_type:complete